MENDCQKIDWNFAEEWLKEANKDKFNNDIEPVWSWDCNFKLDFNGSLLSVSSRFYPPHLNGSNFWQGTVKVLLLGEIVRIEEFKASSLNEIQSKTESFVQEYSNAIKNIIAVNAD